MLALVPVRGTPSSEMRFDTIALSGHRSAMRRVFAVTLSGRRFEASTTIVELRGDHWCLGREGAIPAGQIEAALGGDEAVPA